MKEELNIAAILKEKPEGTKLWSPMIGECEFHSLHRDDISLKNDIGIYLLSQEGKYSSKGECILFPSRKMRDWSKFAWKKGDVLVKDGTCVCVFNEWNNEEYTSIKCKYIKYMDTGRYTEDRVYITDGLHLASQVEKDAYISSIEEHYEGKLNLSTLEIEKPEFKDGDIVHCPAGDITDEAIFIAKVETKGVLHSYIYMSKDDMIPFENCSFSVSGCLDSLRLATDSEKQQLFDALKKKGKKWNPDTLQIEDLPKKFEFKTMDWCLMKDRNETWKLCQFGFLDGDYEAPYNAVGGNWFDECIPYNDQTAHLLGTTDDYKQY